MSGARAVGDQPHPISGMDTFSPREIAELVETRGVAKARAPAVTTFVLGVVAGAFIALGGVLSTIIGTGSELGFGATRFLSGIGSRSDSSWSSWRARSSSPGTTSSP
jgi:hypothetical protein